MAVKSLAEECRDERRRTILREAETRSLPKRATGRRGAPAPPGPDQAYPQTTHVGEHKIEWDKTEHRAGVLRGSGPCRL